jgi:hypothetical protein
MESEVPIAPICTCSIRFLRSKAYLLTRLIEPPGASASMLADSVLFSSMREMPVIDICSNEFWRPALLFDVAVAMRAPSVVKIEYLGSSPPIRTALVSTST